MKEKIQNKIIAFLTPLRNLYPETDSIINDLENNNLDSLNKFVNKYYKDDSYSPDIINLINDLVNSKIIDKSYLDYISSLTNVNVSPNYELTKFTIYNNILCLGSKPLNVTLDKFYNLKDKNNNLEKKEVNSNLDNSDDNDIMDFDDDIEVLRKVILKSQLAYLNNAKKFVDNLENMNDEDIYNALLNLNDIRYIQHSISNLKIDTLNRLLSYIKQIEENKHNLINTFMEEAIKRSIHKYKNNQEN